MSDSTTNVNSKYVICSIFFYFILVPGRKPGPRVLILLGYLHPGKGKH